MLRKREETEYADCGCGCGKYAEPPRSCKVCEFAEGDSGYEVGLTCGLLNTKVGVYHYADTVSYTHLTLPTIYSV